MAVKYAMLHRSKVRTSNWHSTALLTPVGFKTLYREGLKNRYGALMQTISGVHYNFSLPMAFWQAKCGDISGADAKEENFCGLLPR